MIDDSTEDLTARYNRIKRAVYLKSNYNLSSGKVQQAVNVVDEEFPSGEMIIEGVKMIADQFPFDLELSEEEEQELEITVSPLTQKDSLTVEEYEELAALQEQDSIALVQYELAYQAEEEVIAEANMEMIKQDFPTLSEESIEENIDLIDEYYQKNMDYMALEEVATHGEEIENNLKQSRLLRSQKSSVVSKVEATAESDGTLAEILYKKYQDLGPSKQCLFRKVVSRYGIVGVITAAYAGKKAEERAIDYYSSQHEKLSRLDAFRHTYWNALMCKNYITTSKSRTNRMNFAQFVSDSYYDCGDVYDEFGEAIDIDARAMDRHNDNVGRRLYRANTSKYKIFGKELLREPSYWRLRSLIRDRIAKSSDYIVKFHPEDDIQGSVNYGKIYDYTKQEVVNKINSINDDRPVYFRKTVAPHYYKRYWEFPRYRTKTIYPTFHSKDSRLSYARLRQQIIKNGSDR